jgi:hypothetical protein
VVTDRPSTRGEMLLLNMEERARKRYELRTERETKRRAIEEEKLAKVQRTSIRGEFRAEDGHSSFVL